MKKVYAILAVALAFACDTFAQVTITPPVAMEDYIDAVAAPLGTYAAAVIVIAVGMFCVWRGLRYLRKI